MKHKLLQTWARKSAKLLAAFALLASTANATADTFEVTTGSSSWPNCNQYTLSINSKVDMGGSKWTATNFSNNDNNWTNLRCGRKNNASVGVISSVSALSFKVTKVTINAEIHKANGVLNAVTLKVADNSQFTNAVEQTATIPSNLTNGSKYTWDINVASPAENMFYKIEFDCGSKTANNGFLGINNLTFTYETTPPSDELGEIKYNGETADGKTFTVVGGTEMKFSAANAETMSITLNNGTPNFVNGSEISWTAPVVEEATEYSLTVKAGKSSSDSADGVSVSANFTVIVTPAPKAETYILLTDLAQLSNGAEVIITGSTKTDTFGMSNTIMANGNKSRFAKGTEIVEPENNKITGVFENVGIFKVSKSDESYVFCLVNGSDNAGKYISGNAKDGCKYSDTPQNYTLSLTDGVLKFVIGSNALFYNKSSQWFNFDSNTTASDAFVRIDLYVKVITPDAPALHSEVETDSEGVITGSTLKFEDVPEGHSIWWRIVPEVAETPADGMVKEEAEFQKYTEPVTLTAGTKGTLHYYAQHDATGGKSETKTAKVNVPDEDTGIAGIEAEDGKADYFNLQGVRVQNPEKGIFIRVQNGKAVKIAK